MTDIPARQNLKQLATRWGVEVPSDGWLKADILYVRRVSEGVAEVWKKSSGRGMDAIYDLIETRPF